MKTALAAVLSVMLLSGCNTKQAQMKQELADFIRKHDSVLIPLSKETNLANWNAAITGKPEDWKKAEMLQLEMVKLFANKESLARLEEIKLSGLISDTLMARQLDVLYRQFLMAKADTAKLNAIVRLQSQVEQKYGNFRAEVKGKMLFLWREF